MKVNCVNKRDISFGKFWSSSALKKGLMFAENNGAMFSALTSLALSSLVRPAAILLTPKTDRENKKIACAKSITSAILDCAITLAISLPVVKSVNAINKNPEKYLKPETITNLKDGVSKIQDSKAYNLANQLFKLGIGIAIAAPKAILNVTGLPYVMDTFFTKKEVNNINYGEPAFKGKEKNALSELIGKTIDSKFIQNLSLKYKDSNFPMHITVLKDLLTTGVFIGGVNKTKKIKDDRKGPLIYNSALSTTLCVVLGYIADLLTDNMGNKFIEKLKFANKNDKNLTQYINGFKIAKPIMVMGIAYYLFIPLISTFFAERIDKKLPINR